MYSKFRKNFPAIIVQILAISIKYFKERETPSWSTYCGNTEVQLPNQKHLLSSYTLSRLQLQLQKGLEHL